MLLRWNFISFIYILELFTFKAEETIFDPFTNTELEQAENSNGHEKGLELYRKNCGVGSSEHDYLECPIDGHWSGWKPWSECQGRCGKRGRRLRFRSCDNPAPLHGGAQCIGTDHEVEACPSVAGNQKYIFRTLKNNIHWTDYDI